LPLADEEKLGPFRIVTMSRQQMFRIVGVTTDPREKSWQDTRSRVNLEVDGRVDLAETDLGPGTM